jgi:hypothetical protein
LTSPLMETNRMPVAPLVPPSRYHAPPLSTMAGVQQSVSTLLMTVGLLYSRCRPGTAACSSARRGGPPSPPAARSPRRRCSRPG